MLNNKIDNKGHLLLAGCAGILLLSACSKTENGDSSGETETAGLNCPDVFGWGEGLGSNQKKDAAMPTAFTDNEQDCDFNEWSWEAFIWANAILDGKPRFLSWKTDGDLAGASAGTDGMLRLGSHAKPVHSRAVSQDGAIIEADGSMLIGPNGYPVYASVHMTDGYFNTVKNNLISTGAYENPPSSDDYFSVGDAVVKATWYRYDAGSAPEGAYTTKAEVPTLKSVCDSSGCRAETTGNFEVVDVALVGMHVVGYVENHPEFLWATFEHKMNAPMIDDDTFEFDASKSNPNDYSFYKANTPYSTEDLLVKTQPSGGSGAVVTFDEATGKFSPVSQIVQKNRTGGDTQTNGPANIDKLNQISQSFLANEGGPNAVFASYNLIGTVWFKPNTYVTSVSGWENLGNKDAVGAISLMNSTAETFLQANKGEQGDFKNCFECHNAGSFAYQGIQPKALDKRRVAISHMVAVGSAYGSSNSLPVKGSATAATASE